MLGASVLPRRLKKIEITTKMARLSTDTHELLSEIILDDLFDKHIYTTFDFVQTSIRRLMGVTKMSYKDALNVKKHIINKNSAVVRNGFDYYTEFIQKSSILSTGVQSIDKILGGGVGTGKIFEVCGLPGSGKTQFCLTLAKNVTARLNQTVCYLDTKRDFRPKRLKRMCDADEYQEEQIINIFTKFLIKQISNIHDLINSLHEIKSEVQTGQLNSKLIIIDSLPAVLYQMQTPQEYNPALNHAINIMRFLTVEMHICLVVTNIYTTWYEDWSKKEHATYTEKAGCGKYWKSIPNATLTFRKQLENQEIEVTFDEQFMSNPRKCMVSIKDSGIC